MFETDGPPRFADASRAIIGACIEVHRHLGPGLLESVYERCLAHELSLRSIAFRRQVSAALEYKGLVIEPAYRVDFVVEDHVVVEVKAIAALLAVHEAQLLTYLRVTGIETGLLVNFHVPALREGGIRRMTLHRK